MGAPTSSRGEHLRYGATVRNVLTLQALDRVLRSAGRAGLAIAAHAPLAGLGHQLELPLGQVELAALAVVASDDLAGAGDEHRPALLGFICLAGSPSSAGLRPCIEVASSRALASQSAHESAIMRFTSPSTRA
jgi:hypothetical protein